MQCNSESCEFSLFWLLISVCDFLAATQSLLQRKVRANLDLTIANLACWVGVLSSGNENFELSLFSFGKMGGMLA
jgi:hypothetical protein